MPGRVEQDPPPFREGLRLGPYGAQGRQPRLGGVEAGAAKSPVDRSSRSRPVAVPYRAADAGGSAQARVAVVSLIEPVVAFSSCSGCG
ncbi:hypothetical protein MTP06_59530 [Streptomyces sp. PLM4]|nr:hypothetical protein SFR_0285 [Streptomyces sp. FR-008]KAF0789719.1 hypothetical protein P405_15195 [Streptomyces sp. FR-008]BDH72504.1 hypothetical protein MTP06_59530 [Streptomyces sp. PLM4]